MMATLDPYNPFDLGNDDPELEARRVELARKMQRGTPANWRVLGIQRGTVIKAIKCPDIRDDEGKYDRAAAATMFAMYAAAPPDGILDLNTKQLMHFARLSRERIDKCAERLSAARLITTEGNKVFLPKPTTNFTLLPRACGLGLSHGCLPALWVLADHMNVWRKTRIKIPTLGERIGLEDRQVQNLLRELIEAHLVTRHERRSAMVRAMNWPNTFELHFERSIFDNLPA